MTDTTAITIHRGPGVVVKWNLKADEQGQWATEECRAISVQVYGDFGGAKCSIEGTNDREAPAFKLAKSFNDDMVFEVPGFAGVEAMPRYIRPRLSGGDSSTDVTVLIYMVPL